MASETAAIVTGGASGIGAETVSLLSEEVDVVAALDVDESIEERYADEPGIRPFEVDVADFDAVHDVVDAVESTADVEAVVNNAGVSRYYWIGDLEPEEWSRILEVNLTGQYNLAHAVGPRMYERGSGRIVNVSSGAGQRGSLSAGVHYSASKAGIFGLTKGLAKQLGPAVTVNCVVPGLMDTPLARDSGLWTDAELEAFEERLPLERLGDPREAAELIRFLCSEKSSYITGAVLNVDGGAALV
jgi:3-oxoacyl-[acyl-carrier protein] reductase